MKAIYIEQPGGPEVLQYGDRPDPSAGPGQIVVDAHAASVNGVDWRVRAGLYGKGPYPLILGRDFSGVVSALGEGVTDLRVGDEVFGVLETGREGAYAEKIAIGAAIVAKKPAALSHADAAALALTGLTALCSVEDTLKLKSGETILIQGGAGGVAGFAIQLAKHLGARVITTASAANVSYLRDLGADRSDRLQHHRLHHGGERLRCGVRHRGRRRGDPFVRGAQARRTRRLHRIRTDGADAAARRRHRPCARRSAATAPHLDRVAALYAAGAVRAPEVKVYDLAQAGEALRVSEGRHFRGKLVLKVR